MKQHRAVKMSVIAVVLLVGFLLVRGLKPVSQNAMPLETNEASQATTVADSQSPSPAVVAPIQKPDSQEPPQAPKQNWHEQLLALHGIGKLFGIGGEARMKELQDFVESLDAADVPAAVKELQELQMQNPTETGRDLQLRLLQKWGQSDIHSAADWTAQMPAGSDRQKAIATMAGEWAGQNFADAEAWAGQLTNSIEKQGALDSVADAVVYTNPKAALTLAGTLEASSARDDIIMRAAGVWASMETKDAGAGILASTAPKDAVAWAKQIPDANLQQKTLSSIAISWADTDPVAAGTLAVNSLQPGPLQDMAVIAVVQRWGLTDEAAARAWVNQFPEGKLRQTATATLNALSNVGHPGVGQSANLNLNGAPVGP